MAENSQINPMVNLPPREEYKGAGTFVSSLVSAFAFAVPSAFIADKMLARANSNKNLGWVSWVSTTLFSILGGLIGASKAAEAKKQFDNVQNQRDAAAMQMVMLGQENEQLRAGVGQLQQVAGQLHHTVLEQQKKLTEAAHPGAHTKDHAHEAGHKTAAHSPHSDSIAAGHGANAQKTEHAHAAATDGHAKTHAPTHEKPHPTADASTMAHMGMLAAAHDKQVAANDAGHKPDGHAAKQEAPHASHAAAEHAKAAAAPDLKIA